MKYQLFSMLTRFKLPEYLIVDETVSCSMLTLQA